MKINKQYINDLIEEYKDLSEDEISEEIDNISNMIYALFIATECTSFEVMFENKIAIKSTMYELNDQLN
jgi:hypothetical protein